MIIFKNIFLLSKKNAFIKYIYLILNSHKVLKMGVVSPQIILKLDTKPAWILVPLIGFQGLRFRLESLFVPPNHIGINIVLNLLKA